MLLHCSLQYLACLSLLCQPAELLLLALVDDLDLGGGAPSSLLLLLSLLLQLLLLLPLSLLLDILRALFFLAGALLTGDSSSLTSCCSCASAEAQMWIWVMDPLPSSSSLLPFGSAKTTHAAASPTGLPPVSPPGVTWTMMLRILPTPPSLG